MTVEDDVETLAVAGAVAQLYEREHSAMVRLAALILGSTSTAEEVVHDAFVSVLEREATIVDLGAYLRRVVINNCHGLTRRSLVGRQKVARLAVLEARDRDELPPDVDEIWGALDRLSPKQRTALILRYYADLPVVEIAEAMGERPGTIKSALHRGLANLREELSHE